MKPLLICTGLLLAAASLSAQQPAPKSPAATASGDFGGKTITITYSSPRVSGRAGHIFTKDGLISTNTGYPVWRAGANGATKLHTEAGLDIGGCKAAKGDYSLFVDISDPGHWTLIVNKQTGQGGLSYDKAQDLCRASMTTVKTPALIENLTYTISGAGQKGVITLAWENVSASVPVQVE